MKEYIRQPYHVRKFVFLVMIAAFMFAGFHARAQDKEDSNVQEEFQKSDENPSESSEVADEVQDADKGEYVQEPNILKNVKTFAEDDAFVTEFTFDRPFDDANLPIDFVNQTVQVNIPHAKLLVASKKTNSVYGHLVNRVVTFQHGAGELRSQIVLTQGLTAKQVEPRVQIVKVKNSLQLRIMKEAVAVAHQPKLLPVVMPTAIETESTDNMDEMLEKSALKMATVKAESEIPVAPEKKESEIPVFNPVQSKASESQPLQRMLIAFGIVSAVGLGLLYGLRRYARRDSGRVEATKIKVLAQHHLGPKKSLAIIRVAGESILIGITDQNISVIKSLSLLDEDVPEELPKHFNSALASSMRQISGSSNGDEPDEFSMRGLGEIKTLVSNKMRDMRSYK